MATSKRHTVSSKQYALRITIPAIFCVLLFAGMIFFLILPFIEQRLMEQKRNLTRELMELVFDTLQSYDRSVRSGDLDREEAQALAIEQIRHLRYGPEEKDYFWINDMTPTMIMHPYRKDLEGKNISTFTDPKGQRLFMTFVRTVEKHGAGYVDYMWQWKDDPDRIVPKISYVRLFEPWDWIVGTGIYVEDVRSEIASMTRSLVIVCSAILGIILVLSFYMIRQGRRFEKERAAAWRALQKSETRFRDINQEMETGLAEVFDGLNRIASGDPSVRISEDSGVQLLRRLKSKVNETAENISEIVDLSHEFAIGLAEHFHVLKTVSNGDLEARVAGNSRVEILESLGNVTNQMIESVAREVKERRQIEGALRRSEQRFRDMANLLPTVICEMGPDMRIAYMNNVGLELFGYTSSELEAGIDGRDLFHPEELVEILEQSDTSPEHGPPEGIECRLVKKDGSSFVALVHASPMDATEAQHGVRLSLTDITERKRLEDQLQQSQKMEAIGTLAGGMAHNFNNLLMGIQGYVSLMLLDMDKEHPHYTRLKNIEKQVRSGARLTHQLLGYAREGKYEVKPISLNRLVKETSDTLGMTRKDIRVHHDFEDGLHLIRADQGQIEQVLLNLFVNAADAMPNGGTLYLRTRNVTHRDMAGRRYRVVPGAYVYLTVRDTGRGMDQGTMERVFEPFFTTKGLSKGTGLGLASAYGIVKAHEGYIEVDSTEGVGTVFELFFPALVSPDEQDDATCVTEPAIHGKGETVLIVDDEETVLEVTSEILKTLGYVPLPATRGEEAISLIQDHAGRIDAVLLDMIMPGMSGGETFDRIKEIAPSIKILLSSGYSLNEQASSILKRGCDGFIQKPYQAAELAGKLLALFD